MRLWWHGGGAGAVPALSVGQLSAIARHCAWVLLLQEASGRPLYLPPLALLTTTCPSLAPAPFTCTTCTTIHGHAPNHHLSPAPGPPTPLSGAKRCGGQGDILAGSIATFIAWALSFLESARSSQEVVLLPEINPMVLAAYGACLVTRTASAYAFGHKKRSMVAGDMLGQLGNAMEMLFDHMAGGGGGSAGLQGPQEANKM